MSIFQLPYRNCLKDYLEQHFKNWQMKCKSVSWQISQFKIVFNAFFKKNKKYSTCSNEQIGFLCMLKKNAYNSFFKTAISSRNCAATIKSKAFAAASICFRFSRMRFSISSLGKYCKSCSAAFCFALS